ncbi:MAG: hypothetical protein LC751_18875 [Actinobacteria bacterium]|nr:hypothetical protein [Actinomycetota bacterium]MCA1738034.1 hypothetical protein [Actinomycetota bacterium]
MELLQTLFLVVAGLLLLLVSLAGVAFGSFMALDNRTRDSGVFFAIWWVPAIAASIGLLMRDSVTFVIGAFCFVLAGVALAVERRSARRETVSKRTSSRGAKKRSFYERNKQRLYDKIKEYRKVIS